jgi:hypothetical protein
LYFGDKIKTPPPLRNKLTPNTAMPRHQSRKLLKDPKPNPFNFKPDALFILNNQRNLIIFAALLAP